MVDSSDRWPPVKVSTLLSESDPEELAWLRGTKASVPFGSVCSAIVRCQLMGVVVRSKLGR